MTESQKATGELLEVVIELCDIIRDIDSSRIVTYERIEDRLIKVRGHLARAAAFES